MRVPECFLGGLANFLSKLNLARIWECGAEGRYLTRKMGPRNLVAQLCFWSKVPSCVTKPPTFWAPDLCIGTREEFGFSKLNRKPRVIPPYSNCYHNGL